LNLEFRRKRESVLHVSQEMDLCINKPNNERKIIMIQTEQTKSQKPFKKQYSVAIDTVPLPERPEERIQLVIKAVTPVINQIIADAMSVAIGTWPTPEVPRK
jgi:hypothetical protein